MTLRTTQYRHIRDLREDAEMCIRDSLQAHPDIIVEKKSDSPDEDKSLADSKALLPVLISANAAAEAAKRAASGEANARQSASEAASSAQQTAASATLASGYAEQAKAAADQMCIRDSHTAA